MTHDNDDGILRMPSPQDPSSGWTPRYARGEAAGPAPAGKVFVSDLNTYVDQDIAFQLGLGGPSGAPGGDPSPTNALNPLGLRAGADPHEDVQLEELTEEELEAAQAELAEYEQSLSPTLDELAQVFTPEALDEGIEAMVDTGDFDDTLNRISEATGLDTESASMLVETVVMDVTPIASEFIGETAWDSILYAASSTPDPFARRIVTDVVTGALDPAKLPHVYRLWYNSLPDAD
ncbi:hypothetical protein [Sinorhizobium meliloti]|uniref:hypothetical protein n=1 Tax=Rhizobium meliloti TaxID=382 RepID=UPI000FD52ADC|nr:hypothetical protein [Sinorhizobium meliloti]RVJ86946.1 hypothetical protein CN173_30080 [Sinorhizobium meliloti]